MTLRRPRLEGILHDYVAGDLDDAARRDLETRLENDADARALLAQVRAAHEALWTLRERPEPPVDAKSVLPQIQAAIAAHAFETRPQLALEGRGTRFYRRLAVAATLLCGVTIGLFAFGARNAPSEPALRPPPSASERGLEPFVDAREIDGFEWIRQLEQAGFEPDDLRYTPVGNVIPITHGTTERR